MAALRDANAAPNSGTIPVGSAFFGDVAEDAATIECTTDRAQDTTQAATVAATSNREVAATTAAAELVFNSQGVSIIPEMGGVEPQLEATNAVACIETCPPAVRADLYRTMGEQYCVSGYVRARVEGVLKCHQALAPATDPPDSSLGAANCAGKMIAAGSSGMECAGKDNNAVGDACMCSSSPCGASLLPCVERNNVDDATVAAALKQAAGAFGSLLSWAAKP